MKPKKLIISLFFLSACSLGTHGSKNRGESDPPPDENTQDNTGPSEQTSPSEEEKTIILPICVLQGDEEDSCLAYHLAKARVSPGVSSEDIQQKNYDLKCLSPEGGKISSCSLLLIEEKKI
jgi:hypothetical protein